MSSIKVTPNPSPRPKQVIYNWDDWRTFIDFDSKFKNTNIHLGYPQSFPCVCITSEKITSDEHIRIHDFVYLKDFEIETEEVTGVG